MVDPKENLDMYMFGKYKQSSKDKAKDIVTSCNINIYDLIDTEDGILIMSLKNNKVVYNYKPT